MSGQGAIDRSDDFRSGRVPVISKDLLQAWHPKFLVSIVVRVDYAIRIEQEEVLRFQSYQLLFEGLSRFDTQRDSSSGKRDQLTFI